ncbi:hypothetical protein [Streptomyces sp. NBC_01268]|uniref:hypothetical protein n=1 Tax=Streptomyces sp. NBC_01268 TaxID=2903806 RepID=UPI002E313809|nr:hypothetical protein [Streptomyces sp. NBC_01268]
MTQPAAEQLLNLADRAEKGLTPDEAQRLRDGVAHHCARAEKAEAELDRLTTMAARYADRAIENGERADRAEAAIERVRALHARNTHTGDCEHCSARDYPNYAVPHPCPTIAALDEQQEQTPGPAPAHIGNRANAEDCPACSGTNPPYPFLCPGPKEPQP